MQTSDHRYRLIIFDFDGTLADSFGWFARNINKAAIKYDFRVVTHEDHEKLRLLDTRSILAYLGIPWWKVPFIARYMRSLMARDVSTIKLFIGMDELLQQLAEKKIQLAIVSSNSHENVLRILGDHSKHVNFYECGVSLLGKSTRFLKIIKRARVHSHEVLCIGDEVRDILAAKEATFHCGSVVWGYAREDILKEHGPHYIFRTAKDISQLF